MLGQDVKKKAEDFQQKMEEAKRKAFEAEVLRVDEETETRAKELAKMIRVKDEHLYNEQLKEAESTRQLEEEELKKIETDIHSKLADERRKKETRRREEKRLREEETRQKQHDELHLREVEIQKKSEEERERLDAEARRKSEEERLRLEEEARSKADAERRRLEEEALKKADQERIRLEAEAHTKAEEGRRRFEDEARNKADEGRRKQEEQLQQQREEFMRREEDRKKQEEQKRADNERRRAEEDARRKTEAEQRRVAEEARKKEEEERRVREEEERKAKAEYEEKHRLEIELRRQVEEKQRKETEEARKKAEEKQREREEQEQKVKFEKEARILELLDNAERFLNEGNPKHALVEVAKALVNDPKNAAAVQLEKQIKEVLGVTEPKEKPEQRAKKESAAKKKAAAPKLAPTPKRKKLTKQVLTLICVGTAVLVTLLFMQLKDRIFPRSASVTVLPWTSSSNSPEEIIVGTSLAEEVVNQFQRSKRAHVMGYASAFGLTRYTTDAMQSAFHLGYPYVLQGTLTKSPIAYTANLKLIDSTGSVIWAQQYDKSVAELPDLPVIVASDVMKFLRVSFDEQSSTSSLQRASKNSDAYAFYLRGLELLHRHTAASTDNALLLFQQAIELDENFCIALSAAATSIATMRAEGWNTDDSLLAKGREYAAKAVRANGSLGDGYLALGQIFVQSKEYKSALDQFAAAIKYAPNNSEGYLQRGTLYMKIGKYKEAIEDLTEAYQLNPRQATILQALGYVYVLSGSAQQSIWYHQTALFFTEDSTQYIFGRYADALLYDPMYSLAEAGRVGSVYKNHIELDPNDYVSIYRLARLLQVTGQALEGSSLLENAEKVLRAELQAHPKDSDAMVYLALTLTRLGKFTEAVTLAHRANEVAPSSPGVKYKIAQIFSLQMYSAQKKKTDDKKKEEALKALHDAVALHYDFDELTNADFYNLYAQPEFLTAIQEPVQ